MKNIILLILLINSLFSFAQLKEERIQSEKRNSFGFDSSLGTSVIYKRKMRISFAGAVNYTRISKSGKTHFEFGVRYTQLNYRTDREFNSYKPKSDTFRIRTGNFLLFDIPINFITVLPVSEKLNIMISFGCFYSTYIEWHERSENYLTEDDSFISKEKRIIKPLSHDLLGLDTGVGISRYFSPRSLISITAHINFRSDLDMWGGRYFVFPNLTFGYRYLF